MAEEVKCERCEKLYEEIVNSFRVAIEQMKTIAAEGKGQEIESKTNPFYNRYFGCAIAMDTLLNEYFPERMPKKAVEAVAAAEEKDEVVEEEVPADVTRN